MFGLFYYIIIILIFLQLTLAVIYYRHLDKSRIISNFDIMVISENAWANMMIIRVCWIASHPNLKIGLFDGLWMIVTLIISFGTYVTARKNVERIKYQGGKLYYHYIVGFETSAHVIILMIIFVLTAICH